MVKRKTTTLSGLFGKPPKRLACDDCGADIMALGEYFMVNPEIWQTELGLGWNDNLCIGCLETRMGRKLAGMGDIINAQAHWCGERLLDRLGFEKCGDRWWPKGSGARKARKARPR
jgi:hypothetical protein